MNQKKILTVVSDHYFICQHATLRILTASHDDNYRVGGQYQGDSEALLLSEMRPKIMSNLVQEPLTPYRY
jgi:hypothetical protein